MAEGFLGRLLGDEEAGAEVPATDAANSEALAATLALAQSGHDPDVARAAERFLNAQTRLLAVQTDQSQAEGGLRLSHLHGQSAEGKLRRAGQRIRVAMQLLVAMLAAVIGAFILVMVTDAFASKAVVVDKFATPASLSGRGLTGDVVASALLDELKKLQAATRSSTSGLTTVSAWASDITIDVPETGVSIGEVDRLLHARFGHDLHVGGDLLQTENGLRLTVRGDGFLARSFDGVDLGHLAAEAADYVYGRSQPLQYAVYLADSGRDADALAFLPGAFSRAGTDDERAKLANEWGDAFADLNRNAEAAEKYRLAMSLKAHDWPAWSNLLAVVVSLDGEEAGWRESSAFLAQAAAARGQERPKPRSLSNPAFLTWDLPLALAGLLDNANGNGGAGSFSTINGPAIADLYALMHDPAQASRTLASSDPDDPFTKAETAALAAYDALDRGDAQAAIAPMETYWRDWQNNSSMQSSYPDEPCYLGLAYGLAGRTEEAATIFKRMGAWSRCAAFEGDVLAHAGDRAGAARVWNEGLRVGPDLPMVSLHRGLDEFRRGDLAAAHRDLETASAKAPHFADPLKASGDLLMADHEPDAAVLKYDEALRYAPDWAALKTARDGARHAAGM